MFIFLSEDRAGTNIKSSIWFWHVEQKVDGSSRKKTNKYEYHNIYICRIWRRSFYIHALSKPVKGMKVTYVTYVSETVHGTWELKLVTRITTKFMLRMKNMYYNRRSNLDANLQASTKLPNIQRKKQKTKNPLLVSLANTP